MDCFIIYTLSALSFLEAYRNRAFTEAIAKANMLLADGVGTVWGYKQLLRMAPERITGIDFIDELCRLCVTHGQSVYGLGGAPGVSIRALAALQQRFPGLQVAGGRDGFWTQAEEEAVVEAVNQSGAAVLLVALGQPRQEMFLNRYRRCLKVKVAMGVGGSLDVLAGRVKRAPRWLQRLGLEWLVRLLQEPCRWRRMLGLPHFVYLVLRAKIRG